MTIAKFIQLNRDEIDAAINSVLYRYDGRGGSGKIPDPQPKRTDNERHQWVLNDEGLYNWARRMGCRI